MPKAVTLVEHEGITVVRDDLFPGGTKARGVAVFYRRVPGVVYATPAEGGAQTALATVGARLKKRTVLFVADRKQMHPRTAHAIKLGAEVWFIKPGYLSVVQKRAADYAEQSGLGLVPFGAEHTEVVYAICGAAQYAFQSPDEVWCAGGSGVLARGLALAWPHAKLNIVQVGKPLDLSQGLIKGYKNAEVREYDRPFSGVARTAPPFPSDPHYDAKAWEVLTSIRSAKYRAKRKILFWNVAGPAEGGE